MAKKKNGKAEETPQPDPAAVSPEEEARFAAPRARATVPVGAPNHRMR